MSPVAYDTRGRLSHFPRVSGDEPWWGVADVFKTQFSPRERG